MCVLVRNSNPVKLLTATEEKSSLHNASLPESASGSPALSPGTAPPRQVSAAPLRATPNKLFLLRKTEAIGHRGALFRDQSGCDVTGPGASDFRLEAPVCARRAPAEPPLPAPSAACPCPWGHPPAHAMVLGYFGCHPGFSGRAAGGCLWGATGQRCGRSPLLGRGRALGSPAAGCRAARWLHVAVASRGQAEGASRQQQTWLLEYL